MYVIVFPAQNFVFILLTKEKKKLSFFSILSDFSGFLLHYMQSMILFYFKAWYEIYFLWFLFIYLFISVRSTPDRLNSNFIIFIKY